MTRLDKITFALSGFAALFLLGLSIVIYMAEENWFTIVGPFYNLAFGTMLIIFVIVVFLLYNYIQKCEKVRIVNIDLNTAKTNAYEIVENLKTVINGNKEFVEYSDLFQNLNSIQVNYLKRCLRIKNDKAFMSAYTIIAFTSSDLKSLMLIAAENELIDVIDVLIVAENIDINDVVEPIEMRTVAHIIASKNRADFLIYLEGLGADMDKEDKSEKKPYELLGEKARKVMDKLLGETVSGKDSSENETPHPEN